MTHPKLLFFARLRDCFVFLASLTLLHWLPHTVRAEADAHHFPVYPAISANIIFWEKVYETYSVNTAIIHDQNELNRVYAILNLTDSNVPGARMRNSRLLKNEKKRYADLLIRLSKKNQPTTKQEKRVALLFGEKYSSKELQKAATNIRVQTGLKERFTEGVIRSGAYMKEIKRIFASHGLPQDLAYLPHVESSFNPAAFSKFGAAGMWQFTRSTGKDFLRIDYIIDERRDPLIAAEAAAKFLKRNYLALGSWPLALTAYNYGPSGMKRALEQEGSYEKIFSNYRKGHFKFASRNFYSEFLAAVRVAKKQERSHHLRLAKPLATVSVKLPGYVDAANLCRYLNITPGTMHRYNPSLREPVFKGTKYIPADYVLQLPAQFKTSGLLSRAPSSLFRAEQKRSKFYQVRPGDTASVIARAHKISLNSLIKANNLNPQAFLRVGQNLRIPSPANGSAAKISPARYDSEGLVLRGGKKLSPAVLEGGIEQDSAVIGNLKVTDISKTNNLLSGAIEVQPDESIGILADWLKATPESIRLTNAISPHQDIHPGQHIILEFLNVSIEDFEENRFDYHQETQEDFFSSYNIVGITSYKVVAGDTIWDICHKKFDLPLWLLKKYNDNLNFNHLALSSSLQIPIVNEI